MEIGNAGSLGSIWIGLTLSYVFPALPHAREGDYARAKAIVLEGIAAIGEHPELLYQLACCEAQLGEADAALDHINAAVRAGEELTGLLREQSKIRKQFAGLLDNSEIGRGAESLKPDLYWELLNADNAAVATLGAFYSRNAAGALQAADTFYYSSGGYYVTLTLHQMWPVEIDGKSHTLVWRGDMVSSAALADLHGVEKLGSESAMMKDIAKSIALFRKERGR